jgi:hypothetical protein
MGQQMIVGIMIFIVAVLLTMVGKGGGKFALKTKPRHLKKLFAYTNWLAAVFMVFNAFQANKMI